MPSAGLQRHEARHSSAVSSDQDLFASLHLFEKPGEMGLGFKGVDAFHGCFDQMPTGLKLAHKKAPLRGLAGLMRR